ncbi:MAG: hypothetical protein RR988_05100 [Clostridia bacterium]
MDKIKIFFQSIVSKEESKKKMENIIVLIIILALTLISFNYIFSDKKPAEKNKKEAESAGIKDLIDKKDDEKDDFLEKRLASILNEINGINEASVMIAYAQGEKTLPVYETKENESSSKEEGVEKTEKTIEKNLAYKEIGSEKSPIIEATVSSKVEGVIVVASGIDTDEKKAKIAQAVASVTNIPVYKVQVFSK